MRGHREQKISGRAREGEREKESAGEGEDGRQCLNQRPIQLQEQEQEQQQKRPTTSFFNPQHNLPPICTQQREKPTHRTQR